VQLAADHRRRHELPTPEDADVAKASRLLCGWLSIMWQVVFGDLVRDRRSTTLAYVADALAT